jgi:hypothetical protein
MNYKPTQVTKGVSIKKNPKTGLYEGMPKEWLENNDLDLNVDNSKTVATSHFSDSIRPTAVLPPKILNMIESVPARHSTQIPSTHSGSNQGRTTRMQTQQHSYPIQNFIR